MQPRTTATFAPPDEDPGEVPSIEELNDSWFQWDRSRSRGSVPPGSQPTRPSGPRLGDELADGWFQ